MEHQGRWYSSRWCYNKSVQYQQDISMCPLNTLARQAIPTSPAFETGGIQTVILKQDQYEDQLAEHHQADCVGTHHHNILESTSQSQHEVDTVQLRVWQYAQHILHIRNSSTFTKRAYRKPMAICAIRISENWHIINEPRRWIGLPYRTWMLLAPLSTVTQSSPLLT